MDEVQQKLENFEGGKGGWDIGSFLPAFLKGNRGQCDHQPWKSHRHKLVPLLTNSPSPSTTTGLNHLPGKKLVRRSCSALWYLTRLTETDPLS